MIVDFARRQSTTSQRTPKSVETRRGNTTMRYMLLVYGADNAWTEAERGKCMQESLQLCHDLKARNQYIAPSPLHSVNSATSIRIRDGKRLVTDGPFAETTEQLGGYYIVDVDNLDQAIEI